MERIVDGIAYEGKTLPDCFDVRVWECNGHREISARPVVEWTEVGPAPDWSHLADDAKRAEWDAADEAERKEKNALRAARRAKTMCRRFIKANGFSELATLTYRENQTDERKAKEDARRWFRRMGDLIPGFGYCAGYEPQQRGAWHVHAAIHELPKHVDVKKRMPNGDWKTFKVKGWQVGTMVWRAIVGNDNGMCFIGGKGPGAKKARNSLAKMAAYVAKYITKHYEMVPEGKQRYSHSQGVAVPDPVVERLVRMSLRNLIAMCFWCEDGERVVDHRIGRFKDSYYLCTEAEPPGAVC
ncbi:rolling circle replication-associated protein [Variovorax sp. GB1P17]|uniref:rolling circle replication-associated protein n=1 Tax=Variovorax sp. GB1P17 TaxID=3443740 RepID=UPI003F4776E5